jgi:hypothetical protein
MLASKGCQANAQSQKSYNYSQCQINAPLYLFVFLKKKLSNGKVSDRMFHLFVSRKQLGAIKTCLPTKAGSVHYPQIQNTKLMCLCEEVRRSNLLFFIGFLSISLLQSLNSCTISSYFGKRIGSQITDCFVVPPRKDTII